MTRSQTLSRLALAASTLMASSVAASAQSHGGGNSWWSGWWGGWWGHWTGGSSGGSHGGGSTSVPEIDVASGGLALAAVAAALLLVWEIKRRRKA